MKIQFATPDSSTRTKGNDVTARRWARICKRLGHQARVQTVSQLSLDWDADLLVALHAVKTATAIKAYHDRFPRKPVVCILTGTDVYTSDPAWKKTTQQTMRIAKWLVTLQNATRDSLPEKIRRKTKVIFQSVESLPLTRPQPLATVFEVCVVGHLRKEKDPFRVALAARDLPSESRIQVNHFGAALSDAFAKEAIRLTHSESRYRWFGPYPRWKALRRIARSRLLVQPSLSEGGASTLSEAIALGTPIIASRIPGNIGILGKRFPGLFDCRATQQLRDMLWAFETDSRFRTRVTTAVEALEDKISVESEVHAIQALLDDVFSE